MTALIETRVKETAMYPEITILTKTDSGIYNESGNIAADLFDGDARAMDEDSTREWLADNLYVNTTGVGDFRGWGEVWRHQESGELLSVCYVESPTSTRSTNRAAGGAQVEEFAGSTSYGCPECDRMFGSVHEARFHVALTGHVVDGARRWNLRRSTAA